MKNNLKIALAQLNPIVGDVKGNIIKLIDIRNDLKNEVDIIVVPELYVTGYPIDDLVLRNATAVSAGIVTYTWQSSTDQFNWSTVPSSTSNSQLTFGDSNTPTETTYYRVKITSGNPTPTAVSPTCLLYTSPSPRDRG